MAVSKNIREVETTEADFVANAESKNDGFLTDDTGYPMVKKRSTEFNFWYPEKVRSFEGVYSYKDKTVANLIATTDVSVGDKIKDVDDANNNIQFDNTGDTIIVNLGGTPVATFKKENQVSGTSIEFSNGWKLVSTTSYWALFKDNEYSGFGIGNGIPKYASSSSSSSSSS
jgi:hypothetical protein